MGHAHVPSCRVTQFRFKSLPGCSVATAAAAAAEEEEVELLELGGGQSSLDTLPPDFSRRL
jgi:hypothetical protein